MPNETRYLKLVVDPIRVCGRYKPKFGQGAKEGGLSLDQFQTLYQEDAFYHWMGLDNPMMYAAHKAAGGMTSIYRQIGIGCEKLFRTIIQDSLGLSPTDSIWFYEVQLQNGKKNLMEKQKQKESWRKESIVKIFAELAVRGDMDYRVVRRGQCFSKTLRREITVLQPRAWIDFAHAVEFTGDRR